MGTERMVKTQVYLPAQDLRALHRLARRVRRPVAALVREAVQRTLVREMPPGGPVGVIRRIRGRADEHDSAFDEI